MLFRICCISILLLYATLCARSSSAFPHIGSSDDLKLLQSAALRYTLSGQLGKSISLQERAIVLAAREYGSGSPVVADMYFNLGTVALEASEFQKAQDALEQSVRINPSSATARIKLAEILRLRGHPVAARQQALAAVARHKFDPGARRELALCYLDLGNLTQADRQFFNLSQVLSGKPPANSDHAAAYGATAGAPQAVPAASSASEPAQHSIIRALTAHTQQPGSVAPADAAASQAMLQKAYQQQLRSRMNSKSRVSPSAANKFRSAPRSHSGRQHKASSHGGGGALVPPPPDTVPSYPGVVPVKAQSAPPSQHAVVRSGKHSRASETDTGNKEPESSAHTDKGNQSAAPVSQGSDFLLDWASVKKKQ